MTAFVGGHCPFVSTAKHSIQSLVSRPRTQYRADFEWPGMVQGVVIERGYNIEYCTHRQADRLDFCTHVCIIDIWLKESL